MHGNLKGHIERDMIHPDQVIDSLYTDLPEFRLTLHRSARI